MADAERRVLLLAHPAFKDSFATTASLSAGLHTQEGNTGLTPAWTWITATGYYAI